MRQTDRNFQFDLNFNFGVDNIFINQNSNHIHPEPPISGAMLFQDNTTMLLQDNTEMLFL